jgi:AraC-like DNA-binding protein
LAQIRIQAGGEHHTCSKDWIFLRVCSGVGYLLSQGITLDINPADLLVLPSEAKCCLRASRIGPLLVCRFTLQPRHLTGFFTIEEQHAIESYARSPSAHPLLVPRHDPLAQSFPQICQVRLKNETFVLRGEMMMLALRSLQKSLAQLTNSNRPAAVSAERLRQVLGSLTETELLAYGPAELSKKCGCGERHFRRLFRQRYGVSLVTYQIRLRIKMAKRILEESDAKVTDVAFECGFQHLGLFNSMFKRVTGTTPSKWRALRATEKERRKRESAFRCPRAVAGQS